MATRVPPLKLVPLPGSEREAAAAAQPAAEALGAGEPVEATVVLRRRGEVGARMLAGPPIDAAMLGERYGASDADCELVGRTLAELGVAVLETHAASRRIRISAPVSVMNTVFAAGLGSATSEVVIAHGSGTRRVAHRHRTGGLSVPAELSGVVVAVLGLDDRPQASAHFRVAAPRSGAVGYSPVDVGAAYSFPPDSDGTGTRIALIELGGGYLDGDLDTYFSGLGVARPRVTAVGVDGAENAPGADPLGADGEVMLDIEVAGALAPGAAIVAYFAPNTDAGFLDAIATATHAAPAPAAISISWGQSEDAWTAGARTSMDAALEDAALLGITVTVAAGDNGSTDGASDGRSHVDFPASSPHALACGGTTLHVVDGAVRSETVWNDGAGGGATGGGLSTVFRRPSWQSAIHHSHRGVPDVAGNADPQTGYRVLVDGTESVLGGTSAVAPLWAALVARLAQSAGRGLGLVQPALYSAGSGLRDIVEGSNGAYSASAGWDPCTGLGVPVGTELTTVLARGSAGSAGSGATGATTTHGTSRDDIAALIRANLESLRVPGALSARPGYLIVDDWLTDTRAVVVTVSDAAARAALPSSIDGVPVDVRLASPAKQRMLSEPVAFARTAGPAPDRGALPEFDDEIDLVGEPGVAVPAVEFVADAAKPTLAYAPPAGASLTPVTATMTVTLSASPDSGWPTLDGFLSGVKKTLTVGLYDFTSAHILQAAETALKGKTVRIVLDHPAKNPTADQTDEQTVTALRAALADHLTQAWALERMDPLAAAAIFPTAYHIKVAVRDSSAVWLSSGNWNNSNQPDIDPVKNPSDATAARSGDRDWHVVIENVALAKTFEAYLLNDLAVASAHQAPAAHAETPEEALVAPLVTTPPFDRFFAADRTRRAMTVTPLLTPDAGSYAPAVKALIESATASLHMQFQYIELPKTSTSSSAAFEALVAAVIARQKAGVDVRIVMSEYEVAGYLEKLQDAGLDVVNGVKIQNNVHNKGVVVDGRAVLVSSQNWSTDGTLYNRDAGVIIENAQVAAYFEQIFEHDWTTLATRKVTLD